MLTATRFIAAVMMKMMCRRVIKKRLAKPCDIRNVKPVEASLQESD